MATKDFWQFGVDLDNNQLNTDATCFLEENESLDVDDLRKTVVEEVSDLINRSFKQNTQIKDKLHEIERPLNDELKTCINTILTGEISDTDINSLCTRAMGLAYRSLFYATTIEQFFLEEGLLNYSVLETSKEIERLRREVGHYYWHSANAFSNLAFIYALQGEDAVNFVHTASFLYQKAISLEHPSNTQTVSNFSNVEQEYRASLEKGAIRIFQMRTDYLYMISQYLLAARYSSSLPNELEKELKSLHLDLSDKLLQQWSLGSEVKVRFVNREMETLITSEITLNPLMSYNRKRHEQAAKALAKVYIAYPVAYFLGVPTSINDGMKSIQEWITLEYQNYLAGPLSFLIYSNIKLSDSDFQFYLEYIRRTAELTKINQ